MSFLRAVFAVCKKCSLIDFVKALRRLQQFKRKKQLKIERPFIKVWAVLG